MKNQYIFRGQVLTINECNELEVKTNIYWTGVIAEQTQGILMKHCHEQNESKLKESLDYF